MFISLFRYLQENIGLTVSIFAMIFAVCISRHTINKEIWHDTKKYQLNTLKDFRKNFVKATSNLPHSEAEVDWKENICDIRIWFSKKVYIWTYKLIHYLRLYAKWRIAQKERIHFDSDLENFDILSECIERVMSYEMKKEIGILWNIRRKATKALQSFKYLDDLER